MTAAAPPGYAPAYGFGGTATGRSYSMTDYSSYTHKDLLVALLTEVKRLREDLKPKPIVVRNAMNIPEGVSPQAVIQRVEEQHRRVNVRSETAEAAFLRAQRRGPHRKVLDEYMRVFDAEPRDCSPALELPLDERAGRAFGIGRHEYNRYAAGLADALDIPHGSASAVLDGLALVAGGAQ